MVRLSSDIALKVLAPELAADDVFRARFLEESRIAASLSHPNVIPIYDMGAQEIILSSGASAGGVLEPDGRWPVLALMPVERTLRARILMRWSAYH